MKDFRIITGSCELLDRVEPLWKELNAFHMAIGRSFSADLAEHSFDKRKRESIDRARELHISIALDMVDIGYCICSIHGDGIGEIDSHYVKKEYRSKGLGKKLTEVALQWLDKNNARKKVISVLEGNKEALVFYERFGFHPRNIELEETALSADRTKGCKGPR